jgi:hypothetical protein
VYWANGIVNGEWQTLIIANDKNLAWFRAALPEVAHRKGCHCYLIHHWADERKGPWRNYSGVHTVSADTATDQKQRRRKEIKGPNLPGFA